jgi:hypothetical protein
MDNISLNAPIMPGKKVPDEKHYHYMAIIIIIGIICAGIATFVIYSNLPENQTLPIIPNAMTRREATINLVKSRLDAQTASSSDMTKTINYVKNAKNTMTDTQRTNAVELINSRLSNK